MLWFSVAKLIREWCSKRIDAKWPSWSRRFQY